MNINNNSIWKGWPMVYIPKHITNHHHNHHPNHHPNYHHDHHHNHHPDHHHNHHYRWGRVNWVTPDYTNAWTSTTLSLAKSMSPSQLKSRHNTGTCACIFNIGYIYVSELERVHVCGVWMCVCDCMCCVGECTLIEIYPCILLYGICMLHILYGVHTVYYIVYIVYSI